jgi:hypothetical protein
MEFLIGFSSLTLLVPYFVLIAYLLKTLPPEYSLASVGAMLIGDGVIAALVYYTGVDYVESVKVFKLGIASAFMVTTIIKVIYLTTSGILIKS